MATAGAAVWGERRQPCCSGARACLLGSCQLRPGSITRKLWIIMKILEISLATDWVKGKTVEEALTIKNTDITKELCLPPVKLHCTMLAEDAIKSALADYKLKQDPKRGEAEKSALTAAPEAPQLLTPLRAHLKMSEASHIPGKPCEVRTVFAIHIVTDESKIHPLIVLSPVISFSSLLLP
ncbi:Iron-sulfur cluster assembly enzyme ISCU, mitochondrial [Sciurus carolinensis]|uniref:Iron-sulfur cluster assembly enzyme ISCU, mitochondrial n=1 Tax=Sciurus carolinensis TaxID=30640 RepID=A0AA41N742_SCICA|nr:Iron-sulfur cluster assembly enzyme ISCU, mitochondrial [Sciurus carolinensis]